MKRFPTPIKYKVKKPEKYAGDINNVISRSSYETKFMRWCDTNPSVLLWGSETTSIPYFSTSDMKMRKYFPDFFIKLQTSDGQTKNLVVEIKPHCQTIPPVKGRKRMTTFLEECKVWQVNSDKWKHAKEWARQNNFEFVTLDEYSLGIKKRPTK